MTRSNLSERAFFSDLTRLFMSMKDASFAELEAKIEERFRDYVRGCGDPSVGTLQITMTLTLPEGAGSWAVYATEYNTLPLPPVHAPRHPTTLDGSAQIIPFPRHPAAPGRLPTEPADAIDAAVTGPRNPLVCPLP